MQITIRRTLQDFQRFASLLLVLCLVQPAAFSFCKPMPRLICAEYSQSKLVVIAKLTRKQHFHPQGQQDFFVYTMEPVRALHGEVGDQFRIWEENSSGRSAFG